MRKIKTTITNEICVKNIKGYFERTINKFGTGAKIDAPKEYLGKKVIIIVTAALICRILKHGDAIFN